MNAGTGCQRVYEMGSIIMSMKLFIQRAASVALVAGFAGTALSASNRNAPKFLKNTGGICLRFIRTTRPGEPRKTS